MLSGSRWAQKPPVGTPINWSSGLATGIVACVPLWEGTGLPTEIVSGVRATAMAAKWGVGPQGSQLSATGNAGFVSIQTPTLATPWTGPVSIACYAAPSAVAATQNLVSGHTFFLQWGSYGGTSLSAGFQSSNLVASGVVDGAPHAWGATLYPSSTGISSLYRDGVQVATGTITTTSSVTVWLGGLGCTPTQSAGLVGSLGWAIVWSRALTPWEHAALAADPRAIFGRWHDTPGLYAARPGPRVSYPRGSSTCRPVHLATSDFTCYLD